MRNDIQQTGFASLAKRPPFEPPDSVPKRRAPRQLPTDEVCPGDLQALFGRNLRVARLKQAMTLDDVASAIGMTNQYVSKVERGRTNLTLSTMKKLSTAVNLDPGDMLKPSTPDKKAPTQQAKKKPPL